MPDELLAALPAEALASFTGPQASSPKPVRRAVRGAPGAGFLDVLEGAKGRGGEGFGLPAYDPLRADARFAALLRRLEVRPR